METKNNQKDNLSWPSSPHNLSTEAYIPFKIISKQ